jgi:hypothetical protein
MAAGGSDPAPLSNADLSELLCLAAEESGMCASWPRIRVAPSAALSRCIPVVAMAPTPFATWPRRRGHGGNAGIRPDEGVVTVDGPRALEALITAAGDSRIWAREKQIEERVEVARCTDGRRAELAALCPRRANT